jgi:hypothetical protein
MPRTKSDLPAKRRQTADAANLPAIPTERTPGARAAADMIAAVEAGTAVAREAAADIVALVVSYAKDPSSPNHSWAAKLIAERVLPVRAYNSLVATEAKSEASKPPSRVVINIIPAVVPPAGASVASVASVAVSIPEESDFESDY